MYRVGEPRQETCLSCLPPAQETLQPELALCETRPVYHPLWELLKSLASTGSVRPWDLSHPYPKRRRWEPLSHSYIEFKILVPIHLRQKNTSQCEKEKSTMVPSALWYGVLGLEEHRRSHSDAPHPLSSMISINQSASTAYPLSSVISISCSLIPHTPAEHHLYARPCWSCLGL